RADRFSARGLRSRALPFVRRRRGTVARAALHATDAARRDARAARRTDRAPTESRCRCRRTSPSRWPSRSRRTRVRPPTGAAPLLGRARRWRAAPPRSVAWAARTTPALRRHISAVPAEPRAHLGHAFAARHDLERPQLRFQAARPGWIV